MGQYRVVVEVGPPRGDLYELVQTTFYHVVSPDGVAVMTFEGEMSASLSRETGLWADTTYSGVEAVEILADTRALSVRYHDGRVVAVDLPGLRSSSNEVIDDS